ncbi:UDP-N-acetylmuramate:L-alanyl-gamma-D-glutamyl-meso-diaminopimelate ligase [Flocculibacter collagenilyticus]|uniref:UDP-N-acetylmuramate:L-alanyl-gamma-D-glutamyl- meso-diaminopimelate ligase n=1 Tax=Flocculibacter collagenilyticus TaxID=2744479 RepID=UPI0018F309F5|nr:UDP-N-acetylmuramate:L-alanyl-gamma-D-glutamyl-meso-diaminopimelate ligase [Flocculibacter collagenilyticus]
MHIHILGICGTFMGGIAVIAKQLGFKVTGSDANVYPPMSTQLEDIGIELMQGYQPEHLSPEPDLVIVGNAMSRGNPAVEYMLARNIPYTSGPQWLLENVLKDRWVLAVAGTHGKTTTASMLAWILEYAKLPPGFLIGGVPQNFDSSARLGDSPFFVIEADEYDTAFFDKRSKFVHYRPKTVILNNLEFDHADIFADLAAIQTQFHHLMRMVPSNGLAIYPQEDAALQQTLQLGCWTPLETVGEEGTWRAELIEADGSKFKVLLNQQVVGEVSWTCIGAHNVSNGLMAIAAARHAGVPVEHCIAGLNQFMSPKRRMEFKGRVNGITVIDDFAHHPTAIHTTVAGLRANVGNDRILAVLEPRSNTMKLGVHKNELADSLVQADEVFIYQPANIPWSVTEIAEHCQQPAHCHKDIDDLVQTLVVEAQRGDTILIMSNGGFGGIHDKLIEALEDKYDS